MNATSAESIRRLNLGCGGYIRCNLVGYLAGARVLSDLRHWTGEVLSRSTLFVPGDSHDVLEGLQDFRKGIVMGDRDEKPVFHW